MKRALLKAAFGIAVFGLTLAIFIPAVIAFQAVCAIGGWAAGRYRGEGGLGILLTIVVLVLLTNVSDRIVSYWFCAGGLSDERWSVLRDRPRPRKTI
jgi:hypothetical protein